MFVEVVALKLDTPRGTRGIPGAVHYRLTSLPKSGWLILRSNHSGLPCAFTRALCKSHSP